MGMDGTKEDHHTLHFGVCCHKDRTLGRRSGSGINCGAACELRYQHKLAISDPMRNGAI